MTKIQMTKTKTNARETRKKVEADFVWDFEPLNFEFVSDFVLRASDLFSHWRI
jgi:hypothetical protein